MSIDEDAFKIAEDVYLSCRDLDGPGSYSDTFFRKAFEAYEHAKSIQQPVDSSRIAEIVHTLRQQAGKWQPLQRDFLEAADIIELRMESPKRESSCWQNIDTAPRDESLFLLRDRKKLTVVEASFFWDQEFIDGHPITERYLCLHNMTNDEPIEHGWEGYEWMPCPTTQIEGEE